jgi:hypothetical protein
LEDFSRNIGLADFLTFELANFSRAHERSGDWGKEEHIRAQLNIERQQFSQPTKEMANARPRGLRIWYNGKYRDVVVTFI